MEDSLVYVTMSFALWYACIRIKQFSLLTTSCLALAAHFAHITFFSLLPSSNFGHFAVRTYHQHFPSAYEPVSFAFPLAGLFLLLGLWVRVGTSTGAWSKGFTIITILFLASPIRFMFDVWKLALSCAGVADIYEIDTYWMLQLDGCLVASLLQYCIFRCVSKTWFDFISQPAHPTVHEWPAPDPHRNETERPPPTIPPLQILPPPPAPTTPADPASNAVSLPVDTDFYDFNLKALKRHVRGAMSDFESLYKVANGTVTNLPAPAPPPSSVADPQPDIQISEPTPAQPATRNPLQGQSRWPNVSGYEYSGLGRQQRRVTGISASTTPILRPQTFRPTFSSLRSTPSYVPRPVTTSTLPLPPFSQTNTGSPQPPPTTGPDNGSSAHSGNPTPAPRANIDPSTNSLVLDPSSMPANPGPSTAEPNANECVPTSTIPSDATASGIDASAPVYPNDGNTEGLVRDTRLARGGWTNLVPARDETFMTGGLVADSDAGSTTSAPTSTNSSSRNTSTASSNRRTSTRSSTPPSGTSLFDPRAACCESVAASGSPQRSSPSDSNALLEIHSTPGTTGLTQHGARCSPFQVAGASHGSNSTRSVTDNPRPLTSSFNGPSPVIATGTDGAPVNRLQSGSLQRLDELRYLLEGWSSDFRRALQDTNVSILRRKYLYQIAARRLKQHILDPLETFETNGEEEAERRWNPIAEEADELCEELAHPQAHPSAALPVYENFPDVLSASIHLHDALTSVIKDLKVLRRFQRQMRNTTTSSQWVTRSSRISATLECTSRFIKELCTVFDNDLATEIPDGLLADTLDLLETVNNLMLNVEDIYADMDLVVLIREGEPYVRDSAAKLRTLQQRISVFRAYEQARANGEPSLRAGIFLES